MSRELNKEAVFEYLKSWEYFDKNITEEGEAYKITLVNGNKAVVVTTPHEVGEFFLDFSMNDEPYYSDWYEIMDDPLSEFMAYTKRVVANFLNNDVRVLSKGWWVFKTQELQFQHNGVWHNVFN